MKPSRSIDAGDGSEWSSVHANSHDYFRRLTELLDYQDILLIDDRGQRRLLRLQGRRPRHQPAHRSVQDSPTSPRPIRRPMAGPGARLGHLHATSRRIAPRSISPAAWACADLRRRSRHRRRRGGDADRSHRRCHDRGRQLGGQRARSESARRIWSAGDQLMRSPSRDLIENPEQYAEQAEAMGMSRRHARTGRLFTAIPCCCNRSTPRPSTRPCSAARDEIAPGYLGGQTIAAYAPLDAHDLGWVIVAEVDADEAFAPVTSFTNNLIISQRHHRARRVAVVAR